MDERITDGRGWYSVVTARDMTRAQPKAAVIVLADTPQDAAVKALPLLDADEVQMALVGRGKLVVLAERLGRPIEVALTVGATASLED